MCWRSETRALNKIGSPDLWLQWMSFSGIAFLGLLILGLVLSLGLSLGLGLLELKILRDSPFATISFGIWKWSDLWWTSAKAIIIEDGNENKLYFQVRNDTESYFLSYFVYFKTYWNSKYLWKTVQISTHKDLIGAIFKLIRHL